MMLVCSTWHRLMCKHSACFRSCATAGAFGVRADFGLQQARQMSIVEQGKAQLSPNSRAVELHRLRA